MGTESFYTVARAWDNGDISNAEALEQLTSMALDDDRVTVTVKLGNEAMQWPQDVGYPLAQLGVDMQAHGVTHATVRDLNGNTVGRMDAPGW